MDRSLKIAIHDLRLVLQDRAALLWMFLLPVVFATFFGIVVGGSSPPADATATLTVVNQDQGFLSSALLEELESERLSIREIAPEAKASTPDKVRTLVIPPDFTAKILGGEQVLLRLEKEPDTNMKAALLAEARILAAISRILGQLIEASAKALQQPLTEEVWGGLETAEDLIKVETRFAGQASVTPGGFTQSMPGNVVMFVMLVALTYGAAALTGERQGGQLRRLLTAPVTRAEIILGKIAGRFIIAAAQISVLLAVGIFANQVFGIYLGEDIPALFVILFVYALAVAPLGVMFGAWFKDGSCCQHRRSVYLGDGSIGRVLVALGGGVKALAEGGVDLSYRLGHERPSPGDALWPESW
jgi:ABC-2 type transport system permease protein